MKRPPIEGLPDRRPTCPYCGKGLKISTRDVREGLPSVVVRRVFVRWQGYGLNGYKEPVFCTLTCALHFALASYRAGYRMVTK